MKYIERWLLISLLGWAALHTTTVRAEAAEADADAAQSSEQSETTDEPEPPEPPEPETPAVGAKPASEVFVPTEEISEDFAVSFPVDI
jgi:hypothetical protein